MSIINFAKKRPHLFWHISDLSGLSEEAIIEAVLNYGNFSDVKKMINILGIKQAANLFYRQAKRKRCNLRPEVKNYFKLYFDKYA
jgi:hypothetical protein